MKSISRQTVTAVVLGAITTLAVAWGCSMWIGLEERDLRLPPEHQGRTSELQFRKYARTAALRSSDAASESVRRIDDARGWPFLAMRGGFEIDSPCGRGLIRNIRSAIILDFQPALPGSDKTMTPLLPLAPIWWGFAMDTMVYAASWFVVLAAPRSLRRFVRRRRGRCVDCGYDLKNFEREHCPECGEDV